MKQGLVRNWMSSPVRTISPNTHLEDARRIINAESIRHLPVTENGNLVGVITRRGLLRIDLSALDDGIFRSEVNLKEETVGGIMTRNPITTIPDALLPKAARVMLENKITCLLVVDDKHEMIGIITSSDIFRAIIAELGDNPEHITVNDYMTSRVVTIDPETSLMEVQRVMGVERIRALPVMKEEKLVGLITRTDVLSVDPSRLVGYLNQETSLKILNRKAEEFMTRDLITIQPDADIVDAAKFMLKYKIHCLPVMSKDNHLIGIITESDLFRLVIRLFF
jgi:acetoin utilization protein AcuB